MGSNPDKESAVAAEIDGEGDKVIYVDASAAGSDQGERLGIYDGEVLHDTESPSVERGVARV